MTLTPEQLAAVVRILAGEGGGAQLDVEDLVLAERATTILVEEGFDQSKVFKQASEIALAVRVASAAADVVAPLPHSDFVAVGELLPTQEALL